jgi:guanosine-3',5'-bis(diphosphate) 3'-pyrophosphohydrolase
MKKGEMLGKMIVFATNAHAGQFDKAGRPYILHPLAVLHLANTDDEELQCALVGHDLFEDTGATVEDLIEIGMTDRVITTIMAVTKMPGESKAQYKAKVLASLDAMFVKKHDLKHNSDFSRLKGVRQKDFDRMAAYMLFYAEIEEKLSST